jgi:hypothetical protein
VRHDVYLHTEELAVLVGHQAVLGEDVVEARQD